MRALGRGAVVSFERGGLARADVPPDHVLAGHLKQPQRSQLIALRGVSRQFDPVLGAPGRLCTIEDLMEPGLNGLAVSVPECFRTLPVVFPQGRQPRSRVFAPTLSNPLLEARRVGFAVPRLSSRFSPHDAGLIREHGDDRVTEELGPAHSIDIDGTETEICRATWYIYDDYIDDGGEDANEEIRVGQGYLSPGYSPRSEKTKVPSRNPLR